MKMPIYAIIAFLIAFSVNSFAQSGASIKIQPIQFKEVFNDQTDIWLPIEIPKLHKQGFAYWKLTSEGFLCYSDGRFFYEDNYFQRMLSLSNMYGDWMMRNIVNGSFDLRFASFYPLRKNDIHYQYPFYMPVRGYTQYQKSENINTYLPVPNYFFLAGIHNNSYSSSVNTEENIHKLKPVKLNENKINPVAGVEIRKVNNYKYEKTKIDNSIERNIEWRKYNSNTNNYSGKTYSNGSSNTGTTSTNTGNNGSKRGNNGSKTTQSTEKKSE
jgi:hypothetical protein